MNQIFSQIIPEKLVKKTELSKKEILTILVCKTVLLREFLLAHFDEKIAINFVNKLSIFYCISRRKKGVPLEYCLSQTSFFGRDFFINKSVLIPRAETEYLIEIIKKLKPKKVLDIGTGSGIIAITTKKELPKTEIFASDFSKKALFVARKNAKKLGVKIKFYHSDLLDKIPENYELIVANLPYVNKSWKWNSPDLKYEPKIALYAEDDGLFLIKKLIKQAENRCEKLLLEADKSQLNTIAKFAKKYNFCEKDRGEYFILLAKK